MIRKYRYGAPFDTEAVTEKIETANGAFPYGKISLEKGFDFTYVMDEDDIVYGLGEANRGINKRGYCYISNCTDDPNHTEDKRSLYGAHNFIIVSGKTTFGLFFDYPSELTFDIGYTRMAVSYTHLRAHETGRNLVCRLLLEKKKNKIQKR